MFDDINDIFFILSTLLVSLCSSIPILQVMGKRRSRALTVKSASLPATIRSSTMYPRFSVFLPARFVARVTERITYDVYLMRKQDVIDKLDKVRFDQWLSRCLY